jgi:glycosyltransferase involved in cell wall biosynthesis
MRIVFDMQACQSPGSRHRGIGRYSLAHVRAFITVAAGHEVILILNNAFSEAIDLVRQDFADILDPDNIRVFSAMSGLQDVTENNRWRHNASLALYQDFIRDLKPDVFHVCSLFEGYNDSVTGIVDNYGGINSVTLYDLIPYQYSESYLVDQNAQDWYARKMQSMKSADLVLAISASSREEGIELVGLEPDQVVNISSAIGDHFCVSPCNAERRTELQNKFGLHHDYIMYTGGVDSRKNIEGLIAAYALLPHVLRDGLHLAVVCNMDLSSRERLLALAKASGLAAHELVLTGFVTEDELVDLYNMAKLFVFPSLHEGFGLPALEAMACGIPTLVSNTSSLPEVVGRADMQFDPRDPYAISQAIIQTLDSPERMADLREYGLKQAKNFSWEHTAAVTLQAFEHAVAEKRREKLYFRDACVTTTSEREGRPAPGPRPRLAFVSPLPPCESAIADYAAELLPHLSRYYEIEVVTPQEQVSDRWVRGSFSRRTPEWFSHNAGLYDRVLYHFGDSDLHGHMFGLLEQVPGTVVLHDFSLSNVLRDRQAGNSKSNDYVLALYRSHGYKAVQAFKQDAAQLYPANLPVLTQAMGVIVHSEHNRQLACEFYGQEVGKDWVCLSTDNESALPAATMALRYWQAIESFALEHPLARQRQLLDRLRRLPGHGQQPLASHVELACAVTQNIGYGQFPSCYIDISGLPKVWSAALQATLKTLLLEPPQGWRVELVEQLDDGYQLACSKVCDLLDLPDFGDLPLLTGSRDAWIHINEVLAAPGVFAKLRRSGCIQLEELERLTPQALSHWLQGQAFTGRIV